MIGFIGCGNMASAIIKGLLKKGTSSKEIAVFDIDSEKTAIFSKENGLTLKGSAKDIAMDCDTVVLSVKPNVFPFLLPEIGESLKANDPLIISIAAGKSTEFIASLLPYEPKLVRVMPNLNATVGEAISGFCLGGKATENDKTTAKSFCEAFGQCIEIDEKLFSIYSAIGGCGPAFSFMFIDSLARAGVKNGLTKNQALKAAAQTVLGSAKLILESDSHPWELVDKVCSPGGTTIEGVVSLQKDGFEKAVMNAVEASYNKDRLL
ncbi:MAG: pyrroline-5-carboxylate reductase [Acutalibacteraceae bacterium]